MRTAEIVFPGHPDKVCDQISDAILDYCLSYDKDTRAGIEVAGGHGAIFITGEVTTKADMDAEIIKRIAGELYYKLGYKDDPKIYVNIAQQSPDIAQGVDTGGAGDQGIMVGYATTYTESMMPLEYEICRNIAEYVNSKPGYGPDGKCQVTLDEDLDIDTVVVSVQTREQKIGKEEIEAIVGPIKRYYYNPTGKFEIGGFQADAGLTGRKLAVDNYGPQVPIGGGAFSGKDPSKVDRSAAYMARYLAIYACKNMGFEDATVKLAYSIGIAEPVMVSVNDMDAHLQFHEFDLTPKGIIKFLKLKEQKYEETARAGHFGKEEIWENLRTSKK